jgi:hypothetical protein
MTTGQIATLTTTNGMQVYDSVLQQFQFYQAGAWVPLGGGGGSGTVTSITQGANIILTPSPIVAAGSVALNPVLTGLTSAAIGNISISGNAITDSAPLTITAAGNINLVPNFGGVNVGNFSVSGNVININTASTAIIKNNLGDLTVSSNVGNTLRLSYNTTFMSGEGIRLNNSGDTAYTAIVPGNTLANTTYTLPIAYPSVNNQIMISGTTGTLTWTSKITDGGTSSNNLLVGTGTGSNVGTRNTGFGVGSLSSQNGGGNNSCYGYRSGASITTATGNLIAGASSGEALTIGASNVLLGTLCGNLLLDGQFNVAIGETAFQTASVLLSALFLCHFLNQRLVLAIRILQSVIIPQASWFKAKKISLVELMYCLMQQFVTIALL